MDALTIAFTKPSYIQYLNNLNARSDKSSSIYGIENKELHREDNKLRFNAPLPINEFRAEARRHLKSILVSVKAKNKVMTQNVNVIKTKHGVIKKVQLTPRGELHNATFYGTKKRSIIKMIKVGINGFGRIGRFVFRAAQKRSDIEIVGINDLLDAEYMAICSSMTRCMAASTVRSKSRMATSWSTVRRSASPPKRTPLTSSGTKIGAEYVVESTGLFLSKEKAQGHIDAGAKYVVMSAPSKDDTPMSSAVSTPTSTSRARSSYLTLLARRTVSHLWRRFSTTTSVSPTV